MFTTAENFYAEWRNQPERWPSLREEPPVPPEKLLQLVWFHQRVQRDRLQATDGRTVRVLHPGFWNRGAGPDFRGAVVQFGSDAPQSGDVEVDLAPSGWRFHKHDRNAEFAGVVLHVVWEGSGNGTLPTLPLREKLDAPISELANWLVGAGEFPDELRGQCAGPLRELSEEKVRELLEQAALTRLSAKAAQFRARARASSWEQALWEGLFRALGYKQNVWPMQRLAELRDVVGRGPHKLMQARLLGLSGLLPEEPSGKAAEYVRGLWDAWWRERDQFGEHQLPRGLWRLYGLRPANHPHRRIALGAYWLSAANIVPKLERWAAKSADMEEDLYEILKAPEDEFWSRHWTLRSKSLASSQPLLGRTRLTDLAMNVVLPWFWARGDENALLKQEIQRRYLRWPAGQDNAVLRLARERLLGGRKLKVESAATQQGLLQIVRDFCEQSDATCQQCQFPEMVRQWARKG